MKSKKEGSVFCLDVRDIGCENILLKEFGELGRGLFLRKCDYLGDGVSWEEDILGKKYSLERGFGKRIILELCGYCVEIMWRELSGKE